MARGPSRWELKHPSISAWAEGLRVGAESDRLSWPTVIPGPHTCDMNARPPPRMCVADANIGTAAWTGRPLILTGRQRSIQIPFVPALNLGASNGERPKGHCSTPPPALGCSTRSYPTTKWGLRSQEDNDVYLVYLCRWSAVSPGHTYVALWPLAAGGRKNHFFHVTRARPRPLFIFPRWALF